jgi:hypothetical protein
LLTASSPTATNWRAGDATNNKHCSGIEVPAFVALYPDSGVDDFELEISLPNGDKRRERVHVTVTKSSSRRRFLLSKLR